VAPSSCTPVRVRTSAHGLGRGCYCP
jgi:hypothetical protein